MVAQINYPTFKHNTQVSIEQVRGRSHEEGSIQIFILDDMWFGGVRGYLGKSKCKQKEAINAKSKKTKIYQEKQTLVVSKRPPTEIRIDHGNEMSIYTLTIYLFLCWLVNRFVV
jgi:hypothetical protein